MFNCYNNQLNIMSEREAVMTGYVLCECCHLPIPVTADDVGLTVTCPRTRKLVAVKASNRGPLASPPSGARSPGVPSPGTRSTRGVPSPQSATAASPARGVPSPPVAPSRPEPSNFDPTAVVAQSGRSNRSALALLIAGSVPVVTLLVGLGFFVI
jgi:hypothetical protein